MIGSAIVSLALLSGCRKNNDNLNSLDDFSATSEDMSQAENIYTDVDNMVAQASLQGGIDQRRATSEDGQFAFSSCAVVTNDTVNHVLTIDFGTGCTGHDGKVRSGKVIVNYTGGHYFTPGASWVVTFDNYYVNSRHVEGSRSVLNNGFNTAGNMTWSINAVNMKITRPDGSWRTWNSQRTREMIAGYGDSTCTTDVYKINGTATTTHSNGTTATATITDVIRENSCFFITSGTIEVIPSAGDPRLIDFGNGTCDDLATVTKNGQTRTIHLRP